MSESESSEAPAAGKDRILLIGRRNGAIGAARRCGWKPVVIDVQPRREQAPGAFGGTRKLAVEEAMERFSKCPPIAVAAVATGSVMAAAAIRNRFGIPGLAIETAKRCHDKLVMKKAIAAAGICCAPWVETNETTTAEELIEKLGLPVVMKMPISSGGRGVWVCSTEAELREHLRAGWLAEGFVEGVEMSVETFRANGSTVFRNHTRYLKPCWANVVPAALPDEVAAKVDELAERVHAALEIDTGISHMEIFLGKDGPVFGEIAARPPGGYLMELMARAYDFDPWEALLRLAAGESYSFPNRAKRFAGCWIIHPGTGTVRKIEGLEEARALTGVADITCKLQPGEKISHRVGSGQSKGRIVVVAEDGDACAEFLMDALGTIRITMDDGNAELCQP
ncbi:ATP-grasp domain-containing protein [Haloferula chungangensis]|uniref:ATP-grasp domain-containing protein n=1 Tax=Haloferula chungangensis TaxID=1048331 RepID=A0ABW2L4W6_9BACT